MCFASMRGEPVATRANEEQETASLLAALLRRNPGWLLLRKQRNAWRNAHRCDEFSRAYHLRRVRAAQDAVDKLDESTCARPSRAVLHRIQMPFAL
jgi:hypothetical protein